MKTIIQSPPNRSHPTGFTLIGLLVIGGILLLFSAMLLSMLTRVKARVTASGDIYNQQQILLGMNSYCADYTGSLPGSTWNSTYPAWAYGTNFHFSRATGVTASTYESYLALQQADQKRGQLWPYLNNSRVFLCPADVPNALFFQRWQFISSYVWNGSMEAFGAQPPGHYKLAAFKPNQILQWESDEKVPLTFNDCAAYPDEGPSTRHGKEALVGLFSGAVLRVSISDWYDNSKPFAGTSTSRGAGSLILAPNNLVWINPATATGLPSF